MSILSFVFFNHKRYNSFLSLHHNCTMVRNTVVLPIAQINCKVDISFFTPKGFFSTHYTNGVNV